MANDNAIHEMISAFASGCMDKNNYRQFKEYLESDGEVPPGELGELQNVISLLPVILELENPNPKIKDRVAKRLISLQDEIKEKIRLTKQSTATTKTGTVKTAVDGGQEMVLNPPPTEEPRPKTHATPVQDDYNNTEFFESVKINNQPPPPTKHYELPPRTMKDLKEEERPSYTTPIWAAIVITIVIVIGGLIFVYSSGTDYEGEINLLESRINNLENELNNSTDFVESYRSLIEFFNYKDIQIVNLNTVDASVSGSGKLLLSFEHKEGLLDLINMPALGSNQAFQVWLISDERSYSLGTFLPTRGERYISIPDLPFLPKNQVDLVRVTIEPLTGSELPQGPAVLYGAVNNSPVTQSPRR